MKNKTEWKKQWGMMLRKSKLPGIYEMEARNSYYVRAVVRVEGREVPVQQKLENVTAVQALAWLEGEKQRVREQAKTKPVPFLSGYAKAHLERKLKRRKIKAGSGEEKWRIRLGHILGGVEKEANDRVYKVKGLGHHVLTSLRPKVEIFLDGCAEMVNDGVYSPVTINGWLAVLRTMSAAAALEFDISDFMRGIEDLDTSQVETYPEGSPNALLPRDVARFLALAKEHWPQHYGMIYLGTITGHRPSTLRAIHKGDILWDKGAVWMRRSATRGRVIEGTKNGKRYPVHGPPEMLDVLREHLAQLNEVQSESELLFPAKNGSLRSDSVLRRPFAHLSKEMALGYRITPRAMRRTFNDMASVPAQPC